MLCAAAFSEPSMLEIAIVGSGFMGRMHADAARIAGAHVRGVGVRSEHNADAAREAIGTDRVYVSPAEIAEDPNVDVVHICSPNATHFGYALAALQAGKHVICEKPLGVSVEEAEALAEAAAEAGVVATVPFVYRFYPTVREAAFQTTSGALGQLKLIHGSYLQDWLSDPSVWNWRVDPGAGGPSRAFADIGIHWCDLAEFISGDSITRLCARLAFTERTGSSGGGQSPAATEDAATLMFETDGGASGTLIVSQISHGQKNRLWIELDGSTGAVVFDQEHPDALVLSQGQETRLLRQASSEMSPEAQAFSRVPVGHPQGYSDCFALFVRDTYAAIDGAEPAGLPTFADGLRAARLVDAVLQSAASRSWVEVASSPVGAELG
jgi:predicted dehydrogenase